MTNGESDAIGIEPVGETSLVDEFELGPTLERLAGVVFWGYLLLRWINDWSGGVIVKPGTSFVPPSVIEPIGNGLPVVAGVFDAIAFGVDHLPAMVNALWLTLVLTLVSIVLGFGIAVPLAVTRVYGTYSSYVSLGYTELLRGTPLLAQLFVLYYGLNLSQYFPAGGGLLPNQVVWVAIVGFTLNGSAYQAEYIRAAIESVDPGQLTAGRAVGLTKLQSIRYVVLPQALRYAIPSWSNELVYLIKYSSLAAFITTPELFNVTSQIAADNFRYTAMFTLAALLYLGLVISASNLMDRVEDAVAIPGMGSGRGE